MAKALVIEQLCKVLGHVTIAAFVTLSVLAIGLAAGGFFVWKALIDSVKNCVQSTCTRYDIVILVSMPTLIILGSSFYCWLFIWVSCKFGKDDYRKLKRRTINRHCIHSDLDPKTGIKMIEGSRRLTELKDDKVKTDIVSLIHQTWKYDGRLGRDSKNLSHKSIIVKKILRVNNGNMWNNYKKLLLKLSSGVPHECPEELIRKPVMTSSSMISQVQENQNKETLRNNIIDTGVGSSVTQTSCQLEDCEVFLFHGTKLHNIPNIIEKGFDLKRARNGLYGKAIYFAESSEKADQYTDFPKNRRNTDLAMLVVRVILRRVHHHISDEAVDMATTRGLIGRSKPAYDTVVAGANKRFREFLSFNPKLCYPEYVVLYDRN